VAKDVIEREIRTPELAKCLDVANPNRNTIKRVMEFVGRFGDDVIKFVPASTTDRRNFKNLIITNRGAWTDYTDRINDCRTGPTATQPGTGSQEVGADWGLQRSRNDIPTTVFEFATTPACAAGETHSRGANPIIAGAVSPRSPSTSTTFWSDSDQRRILSDLGGQPNINSVTYRSPGQETGRQQDHEAPQGRFTLVKAGVRGRIVVG
jgi:hypothetical protein